jgi:hypothetical protein
LEASTDEADFLRCALGDDSPLEFRLLRSVLEADLAGTTGGRIRGSGATLAPTPKAGSGPFLLEVLVTLSASSFAELDFLRC